jgi:carboxyl-terminal processing protease
MAISKKIFIFISAVILFSGFITRDNDIYFEINKGIDIFGRVYKEVTLNYVDTLNPQEFMLGGINGMLASLDPYTNFIDSDQQKDIDIITKGKYGGIGATVGIRNDNVTIVDLIEGYSAQRQGMRIGDIIKKINNTVVTRENFDNLSDLLKGDVGTSVSITIKREMADEEMVFNLIREEIEIKNLTYYGFIPKESNNVYLKLSGFTRTAGDEIKNALIELKSQKSIESIVLDLRGNPGGLLDAAIDVCKKFLNKNQLIVSVKGRDSLNVKNYYSNEEPIMANTKMVLLIDEGSASASEIVAGAFQDHDRAVLVGTNSYGKGLVQTLIPLSFNTSLKITTARYYTPSGRSIQKINYSSKNKIFEKNSLLVSKKFKTDKNRIVLSAGGIMPDTVVKYESGSRLVQKFLADGIFFKFATGVYNKDVKFDINNYPDRVLIKDFIEYLQNEKYKYTSKTQKAVEQIIETGKEENLDSKLIEQFSKMKSQLEINLVNEVKKNKEEIIYNIMEELAARTNGRQGRIQESLKYDKQFASAVKILNNTKQYNHILH